MGASTRRGGSRASIGPASMTTGGRWGASSRWERRWRRLRARRTISTCSSPAMMAECTRPGGLTGSTGRASTITGARIGGFFPVGAPLGAVTRTPDNLDLFICGNDGRVYTSWWFNGVDWSGINDNWRSLGASSRQGGTLPLLPARRTTSIYSLPATMARSTRRGGSTGSTGPGSTTTGWHSAGSFPWGAARGGRANREQPRPFRHRQRWARLFLVVERISCSRRDPSRHTPAHGRSKIVLGVTEAILAKIDDLRREGVEGERSCGGARTSRPAC